MERLDRLHLEYPFLGSRKLAALLSSPGEVVNRKCVQRLMRLMGLACLFSSKKTDMPTKCHKKYPYLLKGKRVERPNQVWSADITYIPLGTGHMYLAATIDWYSRLVVSWQLSNSLEGSFCLAMLEESLKKGRPEIFNTDQGSQFTTEKWTSQLESVGIRVSMAGAGRCYDNIFVERLWRSVKYEDVYPKRYATVRELESGLKEYFRFYNEVRPHQSLGNKPPASVHGEG